MDLDSRVVRSIPNSSNVASSKRSQGGVFGKAQVCTFWIQGRCKRNPCNFLHSFETSNNGASNNGPSKRLSTHRDIAVRLGSRRAPLPKPRRNQDLPCNYFLRDTCTRGETCNFLHSHSSSPKITFVTKLSAHEKVVRAIELPDGSKQLFTGGQDETIRIWDCETGKCINANPVGGDIGCLHSASGYLFAGLPNEVRVWHLQTSAEQTLTGPVGQVHAISVYNDILLAGVQDGNILAWKFNQTSRMFDPLATLGGHTGAVIALEVADGNLFSGSIDKSLRVWDLTSGECIQVIDAHTHVVMSLLYWQQYLISCSLDGKMKVWAKTQNGTFELEYTYPEDHETKEDLDASPGFLCNGVQPVTNPGAFDGEWEGHEGSYMAHIYEQGILSLCGFIDKEGKPILLCSFMNNTVRVFELPSFTEIGMMFSKEDVRSLQVGPGGLLLSSDSSGEIKVWKWDPSTSSMEL